jgi:hypothetical protein
MPTRGDPLKQSVEINLGAAGIGMGYVPIVEQNDVQTW